MNTKNYHYNNQYYELKNRLEKVGNVFLYDCWHIENAIDIAYHRDIIHTTLEAFREQEKIRTFSYLQGLENRLANAKTTKERTDTQKQLQQLKEYLQFSSDVSQAAYVQLNSNSIVKICENTKPQYQQDWFYDLYYKFSDPPYGLRGTDQEKLTLWQDLTNFVGLKEDDKNIITVLDWAIHSRGNWSSFFDDGLEWWGIWCLTIYNANQKSLGCLIASSTD
ncbi:hypothetical protein LU290_08615 [Moraxella nasibovis]|uniref:hypothetical protein n=1 Tax=Moraxella nasibovis TaxID=2904120 RepID=UPI00240ECD63|nr:hypothetical protein [Moraxella nasibovis]WFF38302.1 hypothetical protein LU290_08615 [Moraxella nasibovis]